MLSIYTGLFVSLAQGFGLLYVLVWDFSLHSNMFGANVIFSQGKRNISMQKTVSWSTEHIVVLIPMKTTVSRPKLGLKAKLAGHNFQITQPEKQKNV